MTTAHAFFLGAGLGAIVTFVVTAYVVATLMPEHRWRG